MALTQVTSSMLEPNAQFMGFKNRIINGAMMIDQRNAGASTTINTSNNIYTVDRWLGSGTGSAGVFTIQRSTSTPPAGFTNFLRTTVTTVDSSLAATDFYGIAQQIEGFNFADMGWGTASAANVTLSFWVRSSLTGTFTGSLNANPATSASYVFTYTISAANTWEYKTLTIAGPTSGTFPTDNNRATSTWFSFAMGSDYSTSTVNSWQAAAKWGSSSAVNLMATNGATFDITGVQLEKGSTATSFDYRPYGTELALCQRYCYAQNKLVTNNYYAFGAGFATGATTGHLGTTFPVSMRSNPSVTYSAANLFFVDSSASTNSAFTSITADQVGNNYGFSSYGGATSGTTGGGSRWLANNAAAAWVIWSAEL